MFAINKARLNIFRRTRLSRSRRSRLACLFAVWAAVLLQGHIFLVLQLHQHRAALNLVAKSQRSSTIVSERAGIGASGLICPACQIARHGIVSSAVPSVDGSRLPLAGWTVQFQHLNPSIPSFLKLSGRDPPDC